jgi:hypothetical protein
LAARWKPIVAESQEAYRAEDHDRAAELASSWRPLRDETVQLNAMIAHIFSELEDIDKRIEATAEELREIDASIRRVREGALICHGVEVSGFEHFGLMDDDRVRRLISMLPSRIRHEVETLELIEPAHIVRGDRAGAAARGYTNLNLDRSRRLRISITKHSANLSDLGMIHVVIHESAHVVWVRLLSDVERSYWNAEFVERHQTGAWPNEYSQKDPYEFFAECWALSSIREFSVGFSEDYPELYNRVRRLQELVRE